MTFSWAVVHTVSPLTVIEDGSSNALPVIQSLVDPSSLTVGDMVRVELAQGGRVVVYGAPGGAGVPAGNVSATARVSAPAGWLLCDGSAVSRSTYEGLFTAISTTYGAGDGTTTFNVPNLKGRVPAGVDSGQTEFDTLGDTGGAKTHTHPLSDAGQAQISGEGGFIYTGRTYTSFTAARKNGVSSDARDASSRTVSAPLQGATDSSSTLPPYIALNYIVKT